MKTPEEKAGAVAGQSVAEKELSQLIDRLNTFSGTQLENAPDTILGADQRKPEADDGALPLAPESGEDPPTREAVRGQFTFFITGRKPAGANTLSPGSVPALLHRYRAFANMRYNYPVCLSDGPDNPEALPLTEIIDRIIAAAESPEPEQLKSAVLKLELVIKEMVEERPEVRLQACWDEAVPLLVRATRLKNQKRDLLQRDLAAARQVLSADGLLLPCDKQVPLRLLHHYAGLQRAKRLRDLMEETDLLIGRLTALLDGARAGGGAEQDMAAAFGEPAGEDLDFEAFTRIVAESRPRGELPEMRRKRLTEVLNVLRNMLKTPAKQTKSSAKPLAALLDSAVVESVSAAKSVLERQRANQVRFIRALRIARLEVENRYREEIHDPYFADFNHTFLSGVERVLFPPVIVTLQAEKLTGGDLNDLAGLLSADLPVKILLILNDLAETGSQGGSADSRPAWLTHFGRLAVNLGTCYVLQCTLANLPDMRDGFKEGLQYEGPALFSIFSGAALSGTLPDYLRSAAATESRAFPAFRYDPGRGEGLADCFRLAEIPQVAQAWPVNKLVYRTPAGEEAEMETAFTPADFLAIDSRLKDAFLVVPPGEWHEQMVPAAEYLTGDSNDPESRIPYLLMVESDGVLQRAIPALPVIESARRITTRWRQLQEMGGIHNSHVRAALQAEKARLEAASQEKIAAAAADYEEKLSRTVDELTKDIVSRIAAGLLSEGVSSASLSASPPASQGVPAAPETPEPQDASPEQEAPPAKKPEDEPEDIYLGDPYIDTPLCTSCNDCTRINSKMFAYDENQQAYIKDPAAGTFRQLVEAAEKCPVHIIHPGKPKNPDEPGLEELIERAEKYN